MIDRYIIMSVSPKPAATGRTHLHALIDSRHGLTRYISICIYIHVYIYVYACIYIYMVGGAYLLGLYKIFVYFGAIVHESTIRLSSPAHLHGPP